VQAAGRIGRLACAPQDRGLHVGTSLPHVIARTRALRRRAASPAAPGPLGARRSATRGSVTRSRSSAAISTERWCSPPAHRIRS
jgi:hypothetical protein